MALAVGALAVVLGAVLGAVASFAFQRELAKSYRRVAAEDARHGEVLNACAALATALTAYRFTQHARQEHRLRGHDPGADSEEQVGKHRQEAWSAFWRIALLTDDKRVLSCAELCFERIRALESVHDYPHRLDNDAEEAREAIYRFVREARERLV